METPITPSSLRDDFRVKLAELLPPAPAMLEDADDFADSEAFGDYDHTADTRRDLQYAACLGALIACPSAFEVPYVALCMLAGRYDEALDAIARVATPDVPAPARLLASAPVRLQLIPDPLRPEWSWEIYRASLSSVAVSARPFSTPREALDDATEWAEAQGLTMAHSPVRVHIPRRAPGVPSAHAA